jgi:hypothetical protein
MSADAGAQGRIGGAQLDIMAWDVADLKDQVSLLNMAESVSAQRNNYRLDIFNRLIRGAVDHLKGGDGLADALHDRGVSAATRIAASPTVSAIGRLPGWVHRC